MVIETAKGVIVGDKPQLCATVSRGAIGTNVAEDVFVPEKLIELDFNNNKQTKRFSTDKICLFHLSNVVEYISVSLIHEASSLEKKILTAMDSPFQMPRHTSPYLRSNAITILTKYSSQLMIFQICHTFPSRCTL